MARPAELTMNSELGFAPEVLALLDSAFSKGLNNRMACFLANISEGYFYEVVKEHPKLKERFKVLEENTKLKARMNIANAINEGDLENSKWYLERRDKDFIKKDLNTNVNVEVPFNLVSYGETDRIHEVIDVKKVKDEEYDIPKRESVMDETKSNDGGTSE